METLYKLVGVTDYAEKHLCVDNLEDIKSMIGTECRLSLNPYLVDGKRHFVLIDMESIHEDFVIVEPIESVIKPDNSNQIEKLETEKSELLEALEEMYSKYENEGHLLNVSPSKIKSLIQKHEIKNP